MRSKSREPKRPIFELCFLPISAITAGSNWVKFLGHWWASTWPHPTIPHRQNNGKSYFLSEAEGRVAMDAIRDDLKKAWDGNQGFVFCFAGDNCLSWANPHFSQCYFVNLDICSAI